MAEVIEYRFRLRRALAATWTSLNDVLLDGEIGLETDTKRVKIGPGAWNDLDYSFAGAIPVAGLGITIDDTDPVHPIIHNDGVRALVAGDGIEVDTTDPRNPVVRNIRAGLVADGVSATYAALPAPPAEGAGAVYYVQADSLFYIYDGVTWPEEGAGLDVRGGGAGDNYYEFGGGM